MAYKELQDIKNELALNVFFPAFVDKSFVTIKLLEEFLTPNTDGIVIKSFCFKVILLLPKNGEAAYNPVIPAGISYLYVKSKYELDILKEAGAIHADIMTNIVPELLTGDFTASKKWGSSI